MEEYSSNLDVFIENTTENLDKKIEVIIQPNVADIPVKFYPDCRMKAF